MYPVDRGIEMPSSTGRDRTSGGITHPEFPLRFLAEGESFLVPCSQVDAAPVRRLFNHRRAAAVRDLLISPENEYASRQVAGGVRFWCTRWVPQHEGQIPFPAPAYARGEGFED